MIRTPSLLLRGFSWSVGANAVALLNGITTMIIVGFKFPPEYLVIYSILALFPVIIGVVEGSATSVIYRKLVYSISSYCGGQCVRKYNLSDAVAPKFLWIIGTVALITVPLGSLYMLTITDGIIEPQNILLIWWVHCIGQAYMAYERRICLALLAWNKMNTYSRLNFYLKASQFAGNIIFLAVCQDLFFVLYSTLAQIVCTKLLTNQIRSDYIAAVGFLPHLSLPTRFLKAIQSAEINRNLLRFLVVAIISIINSRLLMLAAGMKFPLEMVSPISIMTAAFSFVSTIALTFSTLIMPKVSYLRRRITDKRVRRTILKSYIRSVLLIVAIFTFVTLIMFSIIADIERVTALTGKFSVHFHEQKSLLWLIAIFFMLESIHISAANLIISLGMFPFLPSAALTCISLVLAFLLLIALDTDLIYYALTPLVVNLAYNNWAWPYKLIRILCSKDDNELPTL